MSGPSDDRTLEQRLLDYLFPKPGPQETALRKHGADKWDIAQIAGLPEEVKKQLVRVCDAAPIIAPDLVRLVVEATAYGEEKGFNGGYEAGDRDGRENERRSVKQHLREQRRRIDQAFEEFWGDRVRSPK